jgi:type VI secretion system Hcp family effector
MSYLAYMTIMGEKQGLISGGCNTRDSMGDDYQVSHMNEISLQSCSHSIMKASSGSGTDHNPIEISKAVDKSSPMLAQALRDHEIVDCTIDFYRISEKGGHEKYYAIVLKGATICSIGLFMSQGGGIEESVSFNFNSITWKHYLCGTEGYDSWG